MINTGLLDYPWIDRRNPVLTALLANYYDVAHDYDVASYRRDVPDPRVRASVACEFGAADGLAEARWVQSCHDASGSPAAFVAALDLTATDVADRLAGYADLPVVRAVRQPLYWAADPLKRLGARPDYLTDPQWWRGFEHVADAGLTWDLLVYDEQLPAALDLVRAFPTTRIVLEAAGWPLDQSADGFDRWRERLQEISGYANVTLKLQGLALLFGTSRQSLGPWVRTALETFGPARCMFATHFPVDRLLWTFDDLLSTVQQLTEHLSPDDVAGFFSNCAASQYGTAAHGPA